WVGRGGVARARRRGCTARPLRAGMKDAFATDLGRGRGGLEAQKRLPGPEEADATLVTPPPFAARAGAPAFGDEGPTEIYGEIASADLSLDAPAAAAASHSPSPLPSPL